MVGLTKHISKEQLRKVDPRSVIGSRDDMNNWMCKYIFLTGAGVAIPPSVGKGVMGGRLSTATGGSVPSTVVPGRVTAGVGARVLSVPRPSWAWTSTSVAIMAMMMAEYFILFYIRNMGRRGEDLFRITDLVDDSRPGAYGQLIDEMKWKKMRCMARWTDCTRFLRTGWAGDSILRLARSIHEIHPHNNNIIPLSLTSLIFKTSRQIIIYIFGPYE